MMKNIIPFLMIFLISCSASADKIVPRLSEYESMMRSLDWLTTQDLKACSERFFLVWVKIPRVGDVSIGGRGFYNDNPKLISKTYSLSTLPPQVNFSCEVDQPTISPENTSGATFDELIKHLLVKWNDPSCSKKIKEYYDKTTAMFGDPYHVAFGVYVEYQPTGLSFGVETSIIHYGSVSCD